MIISLLESTMRTAIDLDENKKEDGSINWNFVDADSYMQIVMNLFRLQIQMSFTMHFDSYC